MTAAALDLIHAVFAKTAAGQQEIQSRSLGLGPMPRRLLVLVDGKRSGQELAVFAAGQDVQALLTQLIAIGCIEARAPIEAVPAPKTAAAGQSVPGGDTGLAGLPLAESRSQKDVEMARNFMTNTTNTVFGMNLRLSTVEAIFGCQTTEDLRRVYPLWVETMNSSGIGAKRLPDFREKLFKVL